MAFLYKPTKFENIVADAIDGLNMRGYKDTSKVYFSNTPCLEDGSLIRRDLLIINKKKNEVDIAGYLRLLSLDDIIIGRISKYSKKEWGAGIEELSGVLLSSIVNDKNLIIGECVDFCLDGATVSVWAYENGNNSQLEIADVEKTQEKFVFGLGNMCKKMKGYDKKKGKFLFNENEEGIKKILKTIIKKSASEKGLHYKS